ncbi:hypothetical protein MBOT_01220 [Mycobacterium botniense]|uniref:Uncharacterized protein n=1 Tax=Mycobacterium botniense TaxID=84962 RepID=A0A7I9XU03_9MYCO|nr:hypothetical protein MBOT_01220 [Mycobacterium botniense]
MLVRELNKERTALKTTVSAGLRAPSVNGMGGFQRSSQYRGFAEVSVEAHGEVEKQQWFGRLIAQVPDARRKPRPADAGSPVSTAPLPAAASPGGGRQRSLRLPHTCPTNY